MLRKLEIAFRKTSLGRNIIASKRKVKVAKQPKRSKLKSSPFSRLKEIISSVSKRFKLGLAITLILTFTILNFVQYSRINTNSIFATDSHKLANLVDSKEFNILFFSYTQREGNYYVDSLALVSLNFDRKAAIIYNINPMFLTYDANGNEIPIRTFLNVDRLLGKDAIGSFVNSIQDLIGQRVDRYMGISSQNLSELISWSHLNIDAPEDMTINGKAFSKGKVIDSAFLASYINDTSLKLDNSDSYTEINNIVLKGIIADKSGLFDLTKYLWKQDFILSRLNTDITGSELKTVMYNLNTLAGNINSKIMSTKLGDKIGSELESWIKPNFTLVDEDIRNTFLNLSVLSESADVEVYNGSSVSGLASAKKRELQNIGINIVKYGNYFKNVDKNYVYVVSGKPEAFSKTIDAIRRSFRGDIEIKLEGYDGNYTGDLIVVIGKED